MNIEFLTVGPFAANCAIVWKHPQQALVIDPGSDAADIETALLKYGLTVTAYLLTHGHADHISALAKLHAERPAPIHIHPADLEWCFSSRNTLPPYYAVPQKPEATFSNDWNVEDFNFQTLETPGHTPGGVSFYFEEAKAAFTGDTLFKGSCGRTDLPGGNGRVLAQSLKKLAALPDDVTVYAGHGEPTTIGQEKKTNFFMQQAAR